MVFKKNCKLIKYYKYKRVKIYECEGFRYVRFCDMKKVDRILFNMFLESSVSQCPVVESVEKSAYAFDYNEYSNIKDIYLDKYGNLKEFSKQISLHGRFLSYP